MSEMLTQAEIKERIRVAEIEARWQRQLRDQAKRDLAHVKRNFPGDGLTMVRLHSEIEFRDKIAKQFAAEAKSYKKRLV